MSQNAMIFDRKRLRLHRERAAADFANYDFLKREMADRLADRLEDINRRFPLALELGCHSGQLAEVLAGRAGIECLIQCDPSPAMLENVPGNRVIADEEAIPFAEGQFDLAMSVMNLHWVNDLPGTLIQLQRCLKPDGLLLASFLGGETLKELRQVLLEADMAVTGGSSPRVSPFVEVRDAGALLQRAGFALPVVDSDVITVRYEDPFQLLQDLRGMGESNALVKQSRSVMPRQVVYEAMQRYREQYSGEDGRVPATFEIITMTAWKPHASQQKPAKRGSGEVSFSVLEGPRK